MSKPKGRPKRSRKIVGDDEVIARAVDQLLMWGFSGEGEVYEVVGSAAKAVLGRDSAEGGTLGPDRIKKIYEIHRPPGWERHWPPEMRQRMKPLRRRHLWTKESLRERCPSDAPVCELAEILLRNRGDWPWPDDDVHPLGELKPSLRWAKALATAGPKRQK